MAFHEAVLNPFATYRVPTIALRTITPRRR